MAWTQTSAVDLPDLIAQLKAFLLANGWTDGGTDVQVNSLGHKFTVTASAVVMRTQTSPLAAVPDRTINARFDQTTFGGVGLSPNYGTNDFNGPFPNVWFFTDGVYAHIAAQVASNRYSHKSFGALDDKGLLPQRIPYHVGNYYYWWNNTADFSSNSSYYANQPWDSPHIWGYYGHNGRSYTAIPVGVPDPSLDFAAGPIFDPSIENTFTPYAFRSSGVTTGESFGYILDFMNSVENKPITGGVPLMPLPFSAIGSNSVRMFLGELPDVRMCKMNGLNPAQTITYAGEDWIVFPTKQLGNEQATNSGTNPLAAPNTVQHGFAYRKA